MLRFQRFLVGLAAVGLFVALAAAQDDRPRGPLADRLSRFRRSLAAEFAPDEPEPHLAPHAHVHPPRPKKTEPKKTETAPPRMTSQSASRAKTDAEVEVKPSPKKVASSTSSRRTAARTPTAEEDESADAPPVFEEPVTEEAEEPEVALIPLHEAGAQPEEDRPVASLARPHSAKTGKAERHAAPEGASENGPLFTRTTPKVTLRATGPRRLAVGQAAEYKLTVTNEGDQPASDLVIMVSLPDSAELASVRPTTGTVDRAPSGSTVQWAIRSLSAAKREEMVLRIVPHDSASLALDVRCGCAAVAAKTTLDVQEAKLALAIEGASEVHCGEREVYRLVISNPGNGEAENTVIHLLPLPPDEGNPAAHRIGTLKAGESKTVEIELVARQGGKLSIQARATADGGLTAAASEDVTVRQAGIQVEVTGPAQQYAGTPATYRVRVRNPGDAPARKVKVVATLPEGSECVAASHDGKIDIKHGRTTWSLSSLAAGGDQLFTVKCLVKAPGENRLEVAVQADGDLKHSNLAKTDVVAVADLALDIADPAGAVPVGEDSVYEVRVRNRGDKAAEGVDVTASFSKGVEPVSVDGLAHSLSAGAVVFQTMASLGPGQEKILKIHAKASTPGSHRFRVELQCKSLGTKLTEEETTLYYADASERSDEGESLADESTAEPPHVAAPKRLKDLR